MRTAGCVCFYFSCQLKSPLNCSVTCEKCPHPKKPFDADSGLGWGAMSTLCLEEFIRARLSAAFFPQSRNITGVCFSFKIEIILSVNCSQPFDLWELGSPSRTVRTVLSNSTPREHHSLRSPCDGGTNPTSLVSSLYILRSDFGSVRAKDEKANPCACPGRWYGSCPRITTRTSGRSVRESALKTSSFFGNTEPFAYSIARNSKRFSI